MIDVSTFHAGQRCPRCPPEGKAPPYAVRRVIAVSIPTDRWRCAPGAQPFPLTEHVREHDATASCDDPASALEVVRAAQAQLSR